VYSCLSSVILRGVTTVRRFWDELPASWKGDRGPWCAPPRWSTEELPPQFQSDRDFLVEAVNESSLAWNLLSETLQNDIEFARSIATFTNKSVVDKIIEKFPQIVDERKFWLAVFDNASQMIPELYDDDDSGDESEDPLYELVLDDAPHAIKSDHEIMLKACVAQAQPTIFNLFIREDNPLSQDRRFIGELLQQKPAFFIASNRYIDFTDTIREFPDLFIGALPRALQSIFQGKDPQETASQTRRSVCAMLLKHFPNEFLTNRDFVRTWFQSGGPFLSIESMASLKTDKEVFLWIARHFSNSADPSDVAVSFKCASSALLKDQAFMIQAIELNPHIYQAVPTDIKHKNFDLFLCAFGTTPGRYPPIRIQRRFQPVPAGQSSSNPATKFIRRVEHDLQSFDEVFVGTLLCGVWQPTGALALLNQGGASSNQYMSLIAAFADLPTGNRLQMLRNASRNLNLALADMI